jgi:photosystem II stability/assembly factor-like uncharacterized protein
MNEETTRQRLRAALGESSYPPDLSSRVVARLGEPAGQRRRSELAFVFVAALLAIALVATIVYGAHAFRERATVPVQPPPTGFPGASACLNFSQSNPTLSAVKMSSPTTGWASGGLRTTDGGAHWRGTFPAALRDGMPAPAISNGLYPPGYTDFYLDGSRAWEMRTYSSSTNCYDHAGVFATTDGGRTWQRSADINLAIPAGWAAAQQLQFVDGKHGWLWVQAGPPGGWDAFTQQTTYLYATPDGGLHWRLVSSIAPSALGFPASTCRSPLGEIVFASTNTAWIQAGCQTAKPELLMSRDGGVTWSIQQLSKPAAAGACPCWAGLPRFFDGSHGVVEVNGNVDPMVPHGPALLVTSDAGLSWQALPPMPSTGYTLITAFVNATGWWAVVTEPGWNKGQPTHDWLYKTADGGNTWVLVQKDLPMGYPVYDLVFIDAMRGLAVQLQNATGGPPIGPGTEVLTTTDGGHTWRSLITQIGTP